MNTETKYRNLTSYERMDFVARMLHCIQNDDLSYELGKSILLHGEYKGLFKNVKIGIEINTSTVENQEA